MEGIANVYELKKDTQNKKDHYEPNRYLGANAGKFDLSDGSGTTCSLFRYDSVK